MAAEQRILKQDGFLDVGSLGGSGALHLESRTQIKSSSTNDSPPVEEMTIQTTSIVYHPNLNVILVFDSINQVKVLDVHSGVILQTYHLGNGKFIYYKHKCRRKLKARRVIRYTFVSHEKNTTCAIASKPSRVYFVIQAIFITIISCFFVIVLQIEQKNWNPFINKMSFH